MPPTMSRLALSLVGVSLIVLSLGACGGDLLDVDTSWTLTTVNGSTPPYTVPNASQDRVITSGIADLSSDHTYILTFAGTVDGGAAQVGQDHGTWAVSHSTFIFHGSAGVEYIAAISGSTFRGEIPGQIVGSSDSDFTMSFSK